VLLLKEGFIEHLEFVLAFDFLSDFVEDGFWNTFLKFRGCVFLAVIEILDDFFHLVHDKTLRDADQAIFFFFKNVFSHISDFVHNIVEETSVCCIECAHY